MSKFDSLAALMDEADAAGQSLPEVSIEAIQADPNQPRQTFDEISLAELAASIKAQGVVQPIVVRPHPDNGDRYIIVAGERRWRAAQIAGLSVIPAIIRSLDDNQVLAVQLVENLNRENVGIIEETVAVARLVQMMGKASEAARTLGKPAAWVSIRRKIARGFDQLPLQSIVDSGATRDPQTLAALVDLAKLAPDQFEWFMARTTIKRHEVVEALNRAKNPPESPQELRSADSEGEVAGDGENRPETSSEATPTTAGDGEGGQGAQDQSDGASSAKALPAHVVGEFAWALAEIIGKKGVNVDIDGNTAWLGFAFDGLSELEALISHVKSLRQAT